MKRYFLTITLFIIAIGVFGQPDCMTSFRYRGIIVEDSIQISRIGLPTTPFIVGYEKKSSSRAFAIFDVNDSVFNVRLGSHLSSDFCRTPDNIITFVFKRIKEYPIKLFVGDEKFKNPIKIIIPIDAIRFLLEDIDDRKEIVIDLGHIQIN